MQNFTWVTTPIMVAAILVLFPQNDASAHRVIARDFPYYDSDVVYFTERHVIMPHWLRRHADFVRWFHLNHHFHDYAIGWSRLYRRYEHDYHYHRKFKGKRWAHSHKRYGKSYKRWARSHKRSAKSYKRSAKSYKRWAKTDRKRYRNGTRRRH